MPFRGGRQHLLQLSAIAQIYQSALDIDVLHDTLTVIEASDAGISEALGTVHTNAQQAMRMVTSQVTDDGAVQAVEAFVDFSTFDERFAHKDTEVIEFLNHQNTWWRGRLIVSERTRTGRVSHILWLVELIDSERRTRDLLARRNQSLAATNKELTEQVRDAKRVAELTQSVTSLLNNMPALTFSKDVETGQYLACNQMFAEFAGVGRPADVVGHTDLELFDQATALHFMEDDRHTLCLDEPYVLNEDVLDGQGNPRQLKTTKLMFIDTTGRRCLLGMSMDNTEVVSIRHESELAKEAYAHALETSVTYERITRALASDYTFIYYVDLDTDYYLEYGTEGEHDELGIETHGEDFFATSRRNALKVLHPEDQELFVRAFDKQTMLDAIDARGTFTLTYRLMVQGAPTFVNLKATRMDDDPTHLIIGVNNVDAQMRNQQAAERVKEERITYARIAALSGDFIAIYTVDPETDHYVQYSATNGFEGLGLAKSGDDFFADAQKDARTTTHPDDLGMFEVVLTKERVLNSIRKNGIFAVEYRLMLEGEPVYVRLKAALVNEKDGAQLVFGVLNIDAQVKREQAYAFDLREARIKANVDALTGVRNKHAYVDLEEEINQQIDEGEPEAFAVVVCDVNDLKTVNDTHGHLAGDNYIKKACANICRHFCHSPVFRVGGDEFVVIARNHDLRHIDEILANVADENERNAKTGEVVMACGMAHFDHDRSVGAVFERADMEMYKNKKALKEHR